MAAEQRISISSEGIAGLGRRLGDIANYLEEKANKSNSEVVQTWGFPSPHGTDGYESVVGDYELARIAICKELRELRDVAQNAGGWYAKTEQLIDQRHRGIA